MKAEKAAMAITRARIAGHRGLFGCVTRAKLSVIGSADNRGKDEVGQLPIS